MDILSQYGWYCNSKRALKQGIGLIVFLVIFLTIGILITLKDPQGLFIVASIILMLVAICFTSDGPKLLLCYIKAKKVEFFPKYINVDHETIPAYQIKEINHIGKWFSGWDMKQHYYGVNLAFQIVFASPIKNIGNKTYFLIRFPGLFDVNETHALFIEALQSEMELKKYVSFNSFS